MEYVIFGFGVTMHHYPKMAVFLYLILFSVMVAETGKAAYGKRVDGQYPVLIRYGAFSHWWHLAVRRVQAVSFLSVTAFFGAGALFLSWTGTVYTDAQWRMAFLLWVTGICTVALIQMLFIQFRNGYKIVFALILCVEVLSLYIPGLPGSWLMYERSGEVMKNGFSIWGVCLFQAGIDAVIWCFGYDIFRPRRKTWIQ